MLSPPEVKGEVGGRVKGDETCGGRTSGVGCLVLVVGGEYSSVEVGGLLYTLSSTLWEEGCCW